LPIVRNGVQITYSVVGNESVITKSEHARQVADLNPRGAANLAGWALSIMAVPQIASRVCAAPFLFITPGVERSAS
jgi:hypothetical protein